MFEAVKPWWEKKDWSQKRHLEEVLTREGVQNGKNHEGKDPNPGPGGSGHSHKGMPEGGSVASHSGGNQQLRSGSDESSGSSYGGGYKESSRVPPGRNREEASSYGNSGGGYGSVLTTTSLLRTNGAAHVIQIIANNLHMVREPIGRRPHLIAVVEPVTPLAIKTRGPAPMAPLGVTMIVMVPSAETIDPILKPLKVPPLDVVIMTEVRLVLMGALARLQMVGVVALGVANTITDDHLILAARGKILLTMVVRNKHFPTGAP